MFDISISFANKIYAISNVLLVVGAVLALVGTIGVFWSGGIREKFSDERIALNEKETAVAKSKAASANERAENIERHNLELKTILENERLERLQLEAKIAPRRLTVEMQQNLSTALSSFHSRKILVKSYASDVEAAVLGTQIIDSLKAARIEVVEKLLSQSSLDSVGLGVRVTGKDENLVNELLTSFASICNLAVSQEPIPKGPGMYTGIEKESDMDAVIFVGAKPITK